jgi:hypothetical protein
MFATCTFSITSPCCLGMEARQCVEFTGVELASGAELAALVEKATIDPVEEATSGRFGGEDGPHVGEGHGG